MPMQRALSLTLLGCLLAITLVGCQGVAPTPGTVAQRAETAAALYEEPIVWVKYEYTAKLPDGSVIAAGASGSGVIVNVEDDELRIYTNRHVIDCGFTDDPCQQRITESVSVRTQDGKIHPVSRIAIAPHALDIALLTVRTANADAYRAATYAQDVAVGDPVTAVGYPAYAARVLEFSVANGRITALKDLLMDDGYAFASIESDAYTYLGSSGGGLFNEDGALIGVNTWIDAGTASQRSIAIRLSALENIEAFSYCEEGYLGWMACATRTA